MKKIKLLIVALVLFVGATQMSAQSKIAHINTQDLIDNMPEVVAAKKELEKISKTYETELRNLASTFEAKLIRFEEEAESKTEDQNRAAAEELQEMERNINNFRQQAGQDLEKKQGDIYQPILEKVKNAIQKVGRAQGFDYVLDSSIGGGIILAEGKDLMADVKKELKI